MKNGLTVFFQYNKKQWDLKQHWHSLYAQKQAKQKNRNFSKYILMYSTEERTSYQFATTWGWVNDDIAVIFLGVINPFNFHGSHNLATTIFINTHLEFQSFPHWPTNWRHDQTTLLSVKVILLKIIIHKSTSQNKLILPFKYTVHTVHRHTYTPLCHREERSQPMSGIMTNIPGTYLFRTRSQTPNSCTQCILLQSLFKFWGHWGNQTCFSKHKQTIKVVLKSNLLFLLWFCPTALHKVYGGATMIVIRLN